MYIYDSYRDAQRGHIITRVNKYQSNLLQMYISSIQFQSQFIMHSHTSFELLQQCNSIGCKINFEPLSRHAHTDASTHKTDIHTNAYICIHTYIHVCCFTDRSTHIHKHLHMTAINVHKLLNSKLM